MIDENGPCWDSHKQVGMKKKNGRLVPNCVPKNEALGKDADIGDYIKDFRKSKAPQFKGKSDKKKQKMAIAAYLDAQESVNEKTYLRKSKKLPNLKVPVKRKPKNYTLADRIRGEKEKKLTTRVEIENEEMTSTASIPNPADTAMGPSYGKRYNPITVHDKRRKKKRPKLLKRFREYVQQHNIGEECEECQFDHVISEATYQGKQVKLNDPIRTSENPSKKFKVYVMGPNGKVVVVRFGDPNMSIKRDNPERRKSFRARHNCDNPGPKYKARYWSCYQWRAGAKVDN